MEFSNEGQVAILRMGKNLQKCRELLFRLDVGESSKSVVRNTLTGAGLSDEFVTALLLLWETDPILNGWESARASVCKDPSEEEYYRRTSEGILIEAFPLSMN